MSIALQPPKLDLGRFLQSMNDLERINPVSRTGKVLCVTGPAVESNGPLASIGDLCRIQTREGHAPILANIVEELLTQERTPATPLMAPAFAWAPA